ncbi:hypothetical protein EYF80_068230 [Liparis tanakae]|uniref:Uncharacterized protein n=1 Tax=Liparis tanakae TaxID=230148 RepID=A0A4Z2DYY1_9TELE|nr:hypothetical protein EYF80_068230 [Liparis tanakae]
MWVCRKIPQERPAGGPSTPPPSRGLRGRRSGWETTSSSSVFPQSDTCICPTPAET